MEMAVAVKRRYTRGETDFDLVAALEKHLASVEKQLEAVIRMASRLPVEHQEEYWALAQDLQKEIRFTREQIMVAREKKSPTE
jgi:hypothetical protein